MRLFTWLLLFVITFVFALVLVLTFMQPEFKQEVGAQILTYSTRPLPVYIYVLGAFVAGLGIGIVAGLVGFVRGKAREFNYAKKIRELEQELHKTAMNIPGPAIVMDQRETKDP
ncbi:MAG: LapA family protein [Chitinispirillaceae bacterium]|jgi:hypothetical protein|nr:LapA family protein [Chitinispirillaceae bacterium]